MEITFARWQTEQIINWLYGIGLGQYTNECRKNYKNGLQLLHATSQELDKVNQLFLFYRYSIFILTIEEIGNEKSITSKEITIMFEWSMYWTNRSKYSRYLLGVK